MFRKILEAERRWLRVHLAVVEKVDRRGVMQEYDLAS